MPFPPYPPTDQALDNDLFYARSLIEATYPRVANSGDADAYAALYTQDAIWSPPDAPDRHGQSEIRFGYIAKNADINAMMHVDDVRIASTLAYVSALARVQVKHRAKGGNSTYFYRGLWLLRKEHGQWKIQRQIWTNKPAEPLADFFSQLTVQRQALSAQHQMLAG